MSASWGGKRQGAGRKAGSRSRRTVELELRAAALAKIATETGIMPLDVMLETMRGYWTEGKKADACAIAKDAAPYLHAKLAAIDHSINSSAHEDALAALDIDEDEDAN